MTLSNLQDPHDPEAVEDCRRQARIFMGRSREYFAVGDLRQASGKGWGAAAWTAKAVAAAQVWKFEVHAQFGAVLRNAGDVTENYRLLDLSAIAYNLHRGCYTRTRFLSSGTIARNLYQMAELLDALEPLTVSGNGQPR
jgi:hypothetical protein